MAALDTDDESKRRLIDAVVDRPLVAVFSQFAALRGTIRYEALRNGSVLYRTFVFQNNAATSSFDFSGRRTCS